MTQEANLNMGERRVKDIKDLTDEDIEKLSHVIDDISNQEIRQITNQINKPLIDYLQNTLSNLEEDDLRRPLFLNLIDQIHNFEKGIFEVKDLLSIPNISEQMMNEINDYFAKQQNNLAVEDKESQKAIGPPPEVKSI